ncbi:MAG: PAS domain-containing protein [Myxococcaceae bacterium]
MKILQRCEKCQIQEDYFRKILSEVPTHVYCKNLDGEYVLCNKFQVMKTGFASEDEMMGLTDFDMPWKADAHFLREIDRQVIETGKPIVAEESGILPNGKRETWLSRKAPLRNEEGHIIGVIGTSMDITAQKENELLERKKHDEFNKIVRQANHAIASPLATLDIFFSMYASAIPEEQRVSIRNSLNTIRGITSSMLLHFSYPANALPTECDMLLLPVLLETLNEKRFEYKNTQFEIREDIDKNTYFSFVHLDSLAFKRMISSAINSFSQTPGITVSLTQNLDKVYISVAEENIGTKITFTFQTLKLPNWIVSEIKLYPNDTVLVLDDDPSIHGAWDLRFSKMPGITVRHFIQGQELLEYVRSLSEETKKQVFLLADYELLNQELNGIDIINQVKPIRSILVTGHYLNLELIAAAKKNQLEILPKILAVHVPIQFSVTRRS